MTNAISSQLQTTQQTTQQQPPTNPENQITTTLSQGPKPLDTNDAEAFRKWIELEVLKIMKQQVSKQDVSQQRIQDLANRTLDMIQPGMTIEELFQNAIKLNDDYPEFDPLSVKLIKEYEHKYKKKAVERVAQLVKSGDLDEAQDVVKKVLEFKMM